MIKKIGNVFKLDTLNTTYLIRVSNFNHVLSEYYGRKLIDEDDFTFSKEKYEFAPGTSTLYNDIDESYSLDVLSTEISSVGKGDYKTPSVIIRNGDDYILDLKYIDYKISNKITKIDGLPTPHGNAKELVIFTQDDVLNIFVDLHYLVFEESDVICRNIVIKNKTKESIKILKAMSMQLDMVNRNFELTSLYGCWAGEGKKSSTKLSHGVYFIDSNTGNSSSRHNPFFFIKEDRATYEYGDVYGFNLMYSGNHQELVELSTFNKLRIQIGINPNCFCYTVEKNASFTTPFAVMTFSKDGINGMSHNMHDFIRENVMKECHKGGYAPILVNNWEATYFDFNEAKLKPIIKKASDIGLEMFVLDDGWFGKRENDTKGLGDYDVNKDKLPHGLNGISDYANSKGLNFGLWFEPEMVNEDSNLYSEHPEWVIKNPLRMPSKSRHQLVLDLSRKEVQDYIIQNMNKVLNNNNIKYVKWDMNRNISDLHSEIFDTGEMDYRYMLGLYRVYDQIINSHKEIYFEGCASGGNRFDLGGLCYFDQIWVSDNTDAYERINIQSGIALGYPLRALSNHVSDAPSHSELRNTPFETRFNVACFGSFGYELNLANLSKLELDASAEQVRFYKNHRDLIINGDFYQLKTLEQDGYALWEVVSKDKSEAIVGYFNSLQTINPMVDEIRLCGLDECGKYDFEVRKQDHNIQIFGGLINQRTPFAVNPHGFIAYELGKHIQIDGEVEHYVISGSALMAGALKLNQQWMGTGENDKVRILGDFGSRIYFLRKIK